MSKIHYEGREIGKIEWSAAEQPPPPERSLVSVQIRQVVRSRGFVGQGKEFDLCFCCLLAKKTLERERK